VARASIASSTIGFSTSRSAHLPVDYDAPEFMPAFEERHRKPLEVSFDGSSEREFRFIEVSSEHSSQFAIRHSIQKFRFTADSNRLIRKICIVIIELHEIKRVLFPFGLTEMTDKSSRSTSKF
jgi:hypothetical protein